MKLKDFIKMLEGCQNSADNTGDVEVVFSVPDDDKVLTAGRLIWDFFDSRLEIELSKPKEK